MRFDLLTEAKLLRRFRAGSRDLLRLYCGYYVAELLDRLTDKGDKQPELFELAEDTLASLADLTLEPRAIVLRWELQMLRLVGHLPSWQLCAQCGQDVSREETAVFGLMASGVLCAGCRIGGRQLLPLPQLARQTFERYSDSRWREIPLNNYPEQHRSVLRRIVKQYLMVLLDRRLNMHAYLEELGR